jgi:multidrug efflux pump
VNIFTQIGFVVLVGLASKNAILIVEFAKMRRGEGVSAREAALDACRLRFRPIVMTSLAFILGVIPLILSSGAGAEMRRTLGTTVFSGMLGVTIFGVFLTPVFFTVVDRLGSLGVLKAGPLRWVGDIVLGLISFRVVRRAISASDHARGEQAAIEPAIDIDGLSHVPIDWDGKTAANGHAVANGNGNGNGHANGNGNGHADPANGHSGPNGNGHSEIPRQPAEPGDIV